MTVVIVLSCLAVSFLFAVAVGHWLRYVSHDYPPVTQHSHVRTVTPLRFDDGTELTPEQRTHNYDGPDAA